MVGTRLSFFSFKYRLYSNSCNLMCAHVCTFMVSTSGSWDPLGMGPYTFISEQGFNVYVFWNTEHTRVYCSRD